MIEFGLLGLFTTLLAVTAWAARKDLNLLRVPAFFRTSRASSDASNESAWVRYVTYNGLSVYYTPELNGGGLGLSYEFVRIVSASTGKVGHVYEYCCGPGFIGFNLLAHGLCDRLTLSDVNPRAVAAVNETIRRNGLEGRVAVYLSDRLQAIPDAERWDLIVSNPPWAFRPKKGENLILDDVGAAVHLSLFQNAHRFLTPGGSILLVESHEYTSKGQMLELLEGTQMVASDYYPPPAPWRILRQLGEYPHVSKCMAVTLRLGLSCLEIYLLRVERSSRPAPEAPMEDTAHPSG